MTAGRDAFCVVTGTVVCGRVLKVSIVTVGVWFAVSTIVVVVVVLVMAGRLQGSPLSPHTTLNVV
jgi:hypothetical protein